MRKFKKVLGIVTVLMLVLTVLPVSVFAAGSYAASANKTTITVGKTATLTITAKQSAGKFTVSSSNPAIATVSKSSMWIDGSHDPASTTVTIKGVKAGTATITINPENVSDNEYNLLTNKKTITITVKAKQTTPIETDKDKTDKTEDKETVVKKSSDATLKNMTSSVVDLDFSKNKTSYTVNVDKTVTSLGLKATVNNSKARVKITGDENFVTGNNIVKVVVTAEDGTTKTYTITVIKSKYGHAPLLELGVKGYELSPEFKPDKYKYTVDAVGITSVELEYKLADKDSKVTIEGADNLKVGENQVKLIVTEKDGTVTTYEITVNVAPSADIVEEENNTVWLIIIIILILLIVIETIYIVVKKKKEGK